MFNFTSKELAYKQIFMQFPIALLYNSKYSKLSDSSKLAYIILKDRLRYSLENNWVDENNNVFFIFTNEELQDILNCGKGKVVNIKKELESTNLLFQKRMGVNKPNRLYLADLEVSATEVYLPKNHKQTLDTKGSSKIELPENTSQTLDTKGSSKIELPKNSPQTLDTKGSSKIGHNLYKEFKEDTLLDTLLDTDKEKLQNIELLKYFSETQDQTFLSSTCLDLIALFSDSIEKATSTVGIIIRAKNKIEKDYKTTIIGESCSDEIEHTLRKVYHKLKTDSKIVNDENYLFGAVCKTFENWYLQSISNDLHYENEPIVPMYNWLNA